MSRTAAHKTTSAWRALAATVVLGLAHAASAGTFPSGNLAFQTSGQQRASNIGDWYTSTVIGGSNTTAPNSTDRIHRFLIEITAAQLAANGGSITISVLDAESYLGIGPCDEVDGRPCDPNAIVAPATVAQGAGAGTEDPTQFSLLSNTGVPQPGSPALLASGNINNRTASFTVNTAGFYELTSVTGATPISGGAVTNVNDDDNAFLLDVPLSGGTNGGGLGSFQGSFQQDTGGTITAGLYFLVGPSVTGLNLRNFDLDCNAGTVSYIRPNNSSVTGTMSGNARWNGTAGACNQDVGGTDTGGDLVAVSNSTSSSGGDAGVWRYNLSGLTSNNQSIFEANDNLNRRLPAFDAPPLRAGQFTMTPSDIRQTQIGVPVDHGFTVTNLYFTTDIFNFTLSGTSASWTTQLLRDPNCDGVAVDTDVLSDTDGDGRLDTGVLNPGINALLAAPTGNSACFVLRTTPQAGANSSDNTRVSAVSFMDNKVNPSSNTTLFVDKITLIPPRISKAFSPTPVTANSPTTLTFTLNNVNALPLTAVNFTDTFPTTPGQMRVAAAPATSTSCGGTVTAAASATNMSFAGGTLPANGSCTVTVNVTAPTIGTYTNTSTAVSSTTPTTAGPTTLAGNVATANLDVVTIAPPSIAKSFSASPIAVNGVSQLRLTITNPNSALTLNGVAVQDAFPAGLVIAPTPALGGTCAGAPFNGTVDENDAVDADNTVEAGDTSLRLVNATLAGGSSCTILVNVTSASNNTYNNVTGTVSSTNGGNGNSANAAIVVNAAPTIAKAFSPATVNVNGTSVLTLTLSNPNSSPLTGAAFTDTYLANLVNTATPAGSTTCGGTVTAAANGGSVALANGTIPANGSCTVMVNVTRNAVGSTNNTIAAGGLTTNSGVSNTAASNTATLTATAVLPPTISKSFNPTPIQNGTISTLTLVIGNPNSTTTLTGVAVNDTYPVGLGNANPANPAVVCTGGSSGNTTGGTNGGNSIGFATGEILPGGSCTVTVRVTSTTNGTLVNTTGNVTSTTVTTPANGGTATANLVVQANSVAPTITKSFAADELGIDGVSVLTFTITNPNNTALFNLGFTDTYPANLVNATPLTINSDCDGVAGGAAGTTATAGGGSFQLNGAPTAGSVNDLPANGSCTITVNVSSNTAGVYNNNTANAGSTAIAACNSNAAGACPGADQRTGNTTSATVTYFRPTISKSFSPKLIASGGSSTLSIVLSNDSDVDFIINSPASAAPNNTPGFTDFFPPTAPSTGPGAMTVAAVPNITNTCGSTLRNPADTAALAAGDTGVRANGGTIPAHGSCLIRLDVTATASGSYVNTIAAGNLATNGGTNAAATSDTLTVPNRPSITKGFSPSQISPNTPSTLTLTLSNNNATAATAVSFTDTLPSGLSLIGTPSSNCGGTITSNATSVTLAGGTIPGGAPGSCTVTATVTSAVTGIYNNTVPIGGLSSSTGSNAAAANAALTVTTTLTVTKMVLPAIFDPVNLGSNPKSIPGGVVPYSIQISNASNVAVDNDTVLITDPLPVATVALCLANPCAQGNPAFTFIQGTPTSTLTFSYVAPNNGGDDVSFSNNNGVSYVYSPTPDINGVDVNVTHIRLNPKGSLAGSNGNFQIRFLVRVK